MDTLIAMRSFARVVETGSFSAVATEQNTNQATISKRVAALESVLGVRLLVRGSRSHRLTEAGQSYYERAINILAEIDEAESEARSVSSSPKGRIRVTLPTLFGSLYVAPKVPLFLANFPDIHLDMSFSERMVNLVEENIDVALRLGDLKDSSLVAKRLGSYDLLIVATPGYLKTHGEPQHPSELNAHNCLLYTLGLNGAEWSFTNQNLETAIQVNGNFQCDTGFGLMEMALANAGIAFMPNWLVGTYIESGELVHILKDYHRRFPINAVYPQSRYIPLKTKCFIDFISEVIDEMQCSNMQSPIAKSK
jgi:DNA-binding transcriptional LysR family regulator